MENLTTSYDIYIKNLLLEMEIVWVITLNDGTQVYSDYNKPDLENPWIRLVRHLQNTGLYPIKIEAMSFGRPNQVIFENNEGLNGIFIKRGVIKEVDVQTFTDVIQAKKMSFGYYNPSKNLIDVRIVSWPHVESAPTFEERLLTQENLEYMYFFNEGILNAATKGL